MKSLEEYRFLARPAELHKSINTLRGIIAGIVLDNHLSEDEAIELSNWCLIHDNLREHHPFNEIIPAIEKSLADGVIDNEERSDILWLCQRISDVGNHLEYYDDITAAIQHLQGLVHGLLADKELSDEEIFILRRWLDDTEFLQGSYPFDELTSLVTSILRDGKVEEPERNLLIAFLGNFIEFKDSYNLSELDFKTLQQQYSVHGICALCPEISFEGKRFVFTGESYKASRDDFFALVTERGGFPLTAVSKRTDYLVVGNAGNPCWAYSCYGRKIERAMQFRKQGARVQIVNETDFWDAIYDSKI